MENDNDTLTYEYRLKCRNCSLHYAVFSFDSNWDEKHAEGGLCPECGMGGVKIIWGPVPHDRPIFTFIPVTPTAASTSTDEQPSRARESVVCG
jgi:hypothetical protein